MNVLRNIHNTLNLLRHDNNTDVAIETVSATQLPNGDLDCYVNWFNIVNPDNIFYIDSEHIIIKKDDVENWKVIELK